MGTRSLTVVYEGNTKICTMYRQFDGYPSGHGMELAEFLDSFAEITNGIRVGEKRKIANGMGCLAAQMIAEFKTGPGGIYLYPTSIDDAGQEYEYHIYEGRVVVKDPNSVIYDGPWEEFNSFCTEDVT